MFVIGAPFPYLWIEFLPFTVPLPTEDSPPCERPGDLLVLTVFCLLIFM